MTEIMLFRVGALQFGIDLPLISNIHSAKSSIVLQQEGGARLLRTESGAEMPLYDLSYLFEGDHFARDSEDKKMIMLQIDENPIGLIVDRIDQVVAVDKDGFEPLPLIFKGPAQICFPRVLKQGDSLVLLLDPAEIVKFAQETIDKLESMEAPAAEGVSEGIEEIQRPPIEPADRSDHPFMPPEDGRAPEGFDYESARAASELDIPPPAPEEIQSDADFDPDGTAVMEELLQFDSVSISGQEDRIEEHAANPAEQTESGASFSAGPVNEPVNALEQDITGLAQEEIVHERFGGNRHIESAVAAMLPEEQLASMVERITRKIIQQAKPAELVRKIFEQALEGLLRQGDGKQSNNSVRTDAQPNLE